MLLSGCRPGLQPALGTAVPWLLQLDGALWPPRGRGTSRPGSRVRGLPTHGSAEVGVTGAAPLWREGAEASVPSPRAPPQPPDNKYCVAEAAGRVASLGAQDDVDARVREHRPAHLPRPQCKRGIFKWLLHLTWGGAGGSAQAGDGGDTRGPQEPEDSTGDAAEGRHCAPPLPAGATGASTSPGLLLGAPARPGSPGLCRPEDGGVQSLWPPSSLSPGRTGLKSGRPSDPASWHPVSRLRMWRKILGGPGACPQDRSLTDRTRPPCWARDRDSGAGHTVQDPSRTDGQRREGGCAPARSAGSAQGATTLPPGGHRRPQAGAGQMGLGPWGRRPVPTSAEGTQVSPGLGRAAVAEL